MKILLFLLFPLSLFGQTTLSCNEKLNEFARWSPANATIRITDHHISVQELRGIVLAIEYDEINQGSSSDFYKFEGSVVATLPREFQNIPVLVSILNDHYKCVLQ